MFSIRIKPGSRQPDSKEWRMCQKKMRHETMESAKEIVRDTKRKARAGNRLKAYKCPICGGFHIGHRGTGWAKSNDSEPAEAPLPST